MELGMKTSFPGEDKGMSMLQHHKTTLTLKSVDKKVPTKPSTATE
jgi:hypothetical protein